MRMFAWTGVVVFLGIQASWWSRQVPRIWRSVVVGQILFAPVLEELVFRGILQPGLQPIVRKFGVSQENGSKRQIQVVSLLSGLLHGWFGHSRGIGSRIQISVFSGIGSWFYGNAYEKHSLAASTFLHGTYNAITLALAMQWGSTSPWLVAAQGIYLLSVQIFQML